MCSYHVLCQLLSVVTLPCVEVHFQLHVMEAQRLEWFVSLCVDPPHYSNQKWHKVDVQRALRH